MEPLKEMFNKAFYQHFANSFASVNPHFNAAVFIKAVTKNLDELSLNARLRNTSIVLQQFLPAAYEKAIKVLYDVAPLLPTGYTALVLPDFVALYGKAYFSLSMEALRDFTSLGSSEFAIREFLKTDFKKTLTVMHKWADDKDHHVRRLASEGSRPRLPWSFKLDEVIKEPALTTGILEKLKADETLYVRKSVANHLNDISKDNTAYMLQLVKGWDSTHPHTAWIIKHASRTLIKKGDQESLAIFNFEKEVKVRLDKFRLSAATIQLGEVLQFELQLTSEKTTPQKLVIDYIIHYPKASGELSAKVFKLKEITLLPGQEVKLTKQQLFKDLTTRKHYAGKHGIAIMVNGKVLAEKNFRLTL
ncbi:DNA alkylation repair protein [Chitinophaga nivalis]|uniref:DNA alkylation repair protein n=1 Tax=Chitinophaga nivalis TaxID=2991709 RepID=A0ABT3IMA2_9BACT|nr:DNA alkylation repair protein [Chitinophaga nivalis]MCW3465211.1 DNA alkylation repair protein [Chitinophaga nivalis]MCW3485097.1 DNA alkylation repair protein [Chitinophaga nivalis]